MVGELIAKSPDIKQTSNEAMFPSLWLTYCKLNKDGGMTSNTERTQFVVVVKLKPRSVMNIRPTGSDERGPLLTPNAINYPAFPQLNVSGLISTQTSITFFLNATL